MKKYIIFRKVIRKLYNLINPFCFRHMFPFSIPKLQMSNLKTLKTSCKLPKKILKSSQTLQFLGPSSSTSITNFTKLIGNFFSTHQKDGETMSKVCRNRILLSNIIISTSFRRLSDAIVNSRIF